ncbi:MAG: DUF2339 domain-containing protein [Caldilinea sp. CFX5]|nr:DUF2339 domain-containing protein [Caldilinea sp. CFX5]
MANDFFITISCLFNLLLVVGVGLLLRWARRRVKEVRARLTAVEAELAQLRPPTLATNLPLVQPIAAVNPALDLPMPPLPVETAAEAGATELPPTSEEHVPVDEPILDQQPIRRQAPAPWTQNPLVAWFVRIHLMVQVGLIVLFFGVGFLVKYAVDQGWFPLELRLLGAALLGVALATIGWRVRTNQRTYGLALIGGGIGIVYLTTFGAYFFYGLLPAVVAFTLFVTLAILYALMAIWNDAPVLAFLATVGAFLAPFLASDGEGSHLVLFSYYAVVNVGVLAIAFYKQWPGLNLVSFLFSLLAGLSWAATAYQPAYFASVEGFLLLFFGFYLTISLWNAWRTTQQGGILSQADTMLLFANPLATLGLQSLLVAERGYWLAYTAFALAALYALLAIGGRARFGEFVAQVFTFFAGFFLLIGMPLRFDAQVTAAFWAMQGLGQLWLGVRQRRTWPQLWGTLIQVLAGGAFLWQLIESLPADLPPFLNHLYLGTLILSIAAIASATIVHRNAGQLRAKIRILAYALLLLGLFWWYIGGIGQFALYAERTDRLAILLLFVTLSGLIGEGYGSWVQWRAPRYTLWSILPAATLMALYMFAWQMHPFAYGWYVWPVVLASHLLLLWRWPEALDLYHAGWVWLTAFLLTWWLVQQGQRAELAPAWQAWALLGVPLVTLVLLGVYPQHMSWPLSDQPYRYIVLTAAPIALFLLLATLWVNQTNSGAGTPLPFVPLLNPLDLLLAAVIWTLWQWSRQLRHWLSAAQFAVVDVVSQWGIWLLSFAVVNMALARAIHHLNNVPFTFTALYASAIVQTTYALVWSVLALTLMYIAHHRHWRHVWLIGATLLGITIIKLFLVDLAQTGSLARIISFIGVGLLTITVAYFWPAPPRVGQEVTR